MVYSGSGEVMAADRRVIKSAKESVYSAKLSELFERGRSPCLCAPLLENGETEFNLCSRRLNREDRESCGTRQKTAAIDDRSGIKIHKCNERQTPQEIREELFCALNDLLETRFQDLSKPIRKNLAILTIAFLHILGSPRSGYGQLSLALLARILPITGTAHSREKRLSRFLKNQRFNYRTVTGSLGNVLLSGRRGFCPVLLDQTKSGSAQALLAAIPYAGRALPLSCYTFEYPFTDSNAGSQPQLEHLFLLNTENSLPNSIKPVWIADRGYARSLLLEQSQEEGRMYIIRGRKGVIITYRGRRMKLNELKCKPGKAIRYKNVLYHSQRQVKVDVVIYYEPLYKETWYLLVPTELRSFLPTDTVVELYRERMQIEQSFRDFKTHIGMRGLKLQIDIAPRMGRLLLSFCLTYVLCVLLGASPLGEHARLNFEIPRRSPRHGTTRTLSALMLSMIMLSHPLWMHKSYLFLLKLIHNAVDGRSWLDRSGGDPPMLN